MRTPPSPREARPIAPLVRHRRRAANSETLVQDNRISWPDSFAVGPDRYLYFTTSHIHLIPRFNQGVDRRTGPYHIYKINIGAPRWQDPKEK